MQGARQAFGHYEIIEKLGEGGVGIVYKARDTRLNRLVALKLLHPRKAGDEDQLRRFQFEAHTASNLNHPNIVVIYDISSEDGVTYIAMEYVRGKTLSQVVPRKGMPLSEALKLANQIANGLGAASAAGIVHRDLKPGNIMVSESGLVKILDFGLAKTFGVGSDDGSTLAMEEQPRTREGTMVGTVAYMSPEQAEGKPLDARSDIFSFGSVLYEMITGQRAFTGATTVSTISSILRDDPPPLSQIATDVPREVETVISRCLRKDPSRRFQTIADLRANLLDLIEETESGRVTYGKVLQKHRRQRSLVKTWLAVAALTAAAAGGWVGWSWFRSTPRAVPPDVTVTPFASYEGFKGYSAFSPDGNQLAFTWTGGSGEITHIFVKVIGTDLPLPVSAGEFSDVHPAFAPDSRSIAFLRMLPGGRTGIYQVSPLGGAARLINQIPTALYQCLAWSGNGKWLLTSGNSPGENRSRIFVVSSADGRYRTLSFGNTNDEFCPALSPDSKRVAFTRLDTYSAWDLFVAPLDENLQLAGPARRLNTPNGLNRQPAWTADGKDVIFANGGTSTTRLWRVPASNDTPAKELPFTGEAVYQPAVAATGQRLAFTHDFNNTNIWKIPVTSRGRIGDQVQILSTARSSYVRPNAFSNDGKHIAFESNISGSYAIWTAGADGSKATLLFSNGAVNSGSPAWSRDNRWLAFDTRSGKDAQIFLISIDGGPPRPITHGNSDNILPAWSRDGKWIYFDSNRTGRFEVFKCSQDGSEPVQVTHSGGWGAQESPDGKWLYFTRTRSVRTQLLKMPVSGGVESEVLPVVHERWWAVAEQGVWFMEREGVELDPGLWSMESAVSRRAHLRFLDFPSGRVTMAGAISKTPAGGLALAPGGRSILVSQVDHQAYEIEVAENFR